MTRDSIYADPDKALDDALRLYRDGMDPNLIELSELSVFPGLIKVQPATARRSRSTGELLGRPTPRFLKRGRNVRYRLKDVLDWMEGKDPKEDEGPSPSGESAADDVEGVLVKVRQEIDRFDDSSEVSALLEDLYEEAPYAVREAQVHIEGQQRSLLEVADQLSRLVDGLRNPGKEGE